jgi:hypothetical protein
MSSEETVTVACKLPHGFIMQLQEKTTQVQPVMGGGLRETEIWVPSNSHPPIPLYGNAHPQNMAPIADIASGFALTYDVPKDFWDVWVAQNKTLPAVKNGLIFAQPNARRTKDEAKEKVGLKTGLERLDPNNLPKEFSKKLETADEFKKRVAA